MSLRRVSSLLCLAACAIAAAGCGGDTLSFDPVASAATKTAASESSRVAFTATMNVDGVGGMAFSGAGVFDGRMRSGALNIRYQLSPDAQAQLGGVDPTMEMIMDGRNGLVMYMRSPLFARVAGDKWIKVDVAKEAKKEGIDLQAVMNSTQADPSQTLAMLTASTDAHLPACITAALATLSGPRHGGACDRVEALLDEAASLARPTSVLEKRARRGDLA